MDICPVSISLVMDALKAFRRAGLFAFQVDRPRASDDSCGGSLDVFGGGCFECLRGGNSKVLVMEALISVSEIDFK